MVQRYQPQPRELLTCSQLSSLLISLQHGVDTAKYYQQAERELEAERTSSS